MQERKTKVGIISLGCPRNLVDSEVLLGTLRKDGYEISELQEADIGVVNTCAFIDDAKRESIDMILEMVELKKAKKLSAVIAAGCLPQRYGEALREGLPEVDAFIGCDQIVKIGEILRRLKKRGQTPFSAVSEKPTLITGHADPRVYLTPSHYVYVKISEGCENACSFCVIPAIKGAYRSRPIESVLKEVEAVSQSRRVSEVNIIGQDTTLYGKDLYGIPAIKRLLRELCAFKDYKRWIRLFYTYPSHIDEGLTDIFAEETSLCKYLDLPIQHINDRILKKMNRGMSRSDIVSAISAIRRKVPGVVIRSSVITGFPGESEEEFQELVEFIKEVRFERLGVFTYSREEGTPAYHYQDQISEGIKLERFNTLMSAQQEIAADINKSYIGREIEVLIDEKDESSKDIYIGRTQGDAPEVDGQVFVKIGDCPRIGTVPEQLRPGDFVNVRITDTLEYDLVGEGLRVNGPGSRVQT